MKKRGPMPYFTSFLIPLFLLVFAMWEASLNAITVPCATHPLMIFIDEKEMITNPVERMFKQAVEQEASIIITTTHLLRSFEDEWKSKKTLAGKKWIAKKMSDYFTLLIPEGFIEKYRPIVAKNIPTGRLSDAYNDYILGIRIPSQSLTGNDINKADKKPLSKTYEKEEENFFLLSKHFIDEIATRFIPKGEFAKFKGNITPPKYGIVLVGHGEAYIPYNKTQITPSIIRKEGLIAQLSFSDLRTFFELLTNGFNQKDENTVYQSAAAFFLIYSCYSGDLALASLISKETIEEVKGSGFFGFKTKVSKKKYHEITDPPFVIAVTTAFSTVTTEESFARYEFKNFFDQLLFCATTNYLTILSSIYYTDSPFNIPLIKIPGMPWTSVLDFKNNIAIIGQILAASRAANDPLYISRYFKKEKDRPAEPKAILIYPQTIPFKIVITKERNGQSFPDIFSLLPGPAKHEFLGGIEAQGFTIADVVRGFIPGEIREYKLFFIKKITAQDDISSEQEKIGSIDDVFIFHNRVFTQGSLVSEVSIFYTKDNRSYEVSIPQVEFDANENEFAITYSRSQIATFMKNAEISEYLPDETKITKFLKEMEQYIDPKTVYNVKQIERLRTIYKPPNKTGGAFGGGKKKKWTESSDPVDLFAQSLNNLLMEKI